MNVLVFTLGADTGGVLGGIARAFRGVQGWNVRSFCNIDNYIGYPHDLDPTREVLLEQWEQADVVHLHHDFRSFEKAYKIARKVLPPKPFVLEYHGTGFREHSEYHLIEQRYAKALGVTSTLDLYLLSPKELEWLPPAVNVDALAEMRQVNDTGRVLIAHAPTNRAIKSTAALIKAVERMQAEGLPVDLDLIERVPWTECLERKAKADIYFDQVILGYGCNALEAWGMGIPVVAGAADETLDEMERRFGYLPFYHATEETIYDALRELVESPKLRAKYGRIGHEYVRRFHSEEVVVEQLKALYRRAMGQQEEQAA